LSLAVKKLLYTLANRGALRSFYYVKV